MLTASYADCNKDTYFEELIIYTLYCERHNHKLTVINEDTVSFP